MPERRTARVVTHSEMRSYLLCRKQHWFNYTERLTPKKKSLALNIGTVVHEALRAYHYPRLGNIQEAKATAKAEVDRLTTQMVQNSVQEEVIADLTESVKLVDSMLTQYDSFSQSHDAEEQTTEVESAYEVSVMTPREKASSKYRYRFKIDALVKRPTGLWLREFKTTMDVSQNYLDQLALDEQTRRYCWGLAQIGKPVVGVSYRVLRKRLQSKAPLVYNEDIFYSEQDIQEASQRMYWLCREVDHHVVIRNPGQHCSWCPYLPVCQTDTTDLREAFYTVREVRHQEYSKTQTDAEIRQGE